MYIPYRFLVTCIEQSSAYRTYRLHSTDSSAKMTAKMIDFSPTRSPAHQAVDAIHGFVPLVAGLFYLVSAAILAFRRDRQGEVRRRPSRAVALWPALAIFAAYVSGLVYLGWAGPWRLIYRSFTGIRDRRAILLDLSGKSHGFLGRDREDNNPLHYRLMNLTLIVSLCF